MKKEDWVVACVRTNRVGSDSLFDVCERSEWDVMSEEEQHKAMLDAAFDAGVIEIFQKE